MPLRIIGICNQGQNRSRQATEIVAAYAAKKGWDVETRCAGIYSEDRPVTTALMEWGDVLLLHQEDHLPLLQERYPGQLFRMRCIMVPVPDVYDYGSTVLKRKLRSKLRGWWAFLADLVEAEGPDEAASPRH